MREWTERTSFLNFFFIFDLKKMEDFVLGLFMYNYDPLRMTDFCEGEPWNGHVKNSASTEDDGARGVLGHILKNKSY